MRPEPEDLLGIGRDSDGISDKLQAFLCTEIKRTVTPFGVTVFFRFWKI
jgi:hypothetical protein